jgi:hypothetical protein
MLLHYVMQHCSSYLIVYTSDFIFLIHVSILWPTGKEAIARKMVCGTIMTVYILTIVYYVPGPLFFCCHCPCHLLLLLFVNILLQHNSGTTYSGFFICTVTNLQFSKSKEFLHQMTSHSIAFSKIFFCCGVSLLPPPPATFLTAD